MGHGAPKKISSIPMRSIVQINVAEGLLYETARELDVTLRAVLNGDETLWDKLDDLRVKMVSYNRQYTTAILNLLIEQKRG